MRSIKRHALAAALAAAVPAAHAHLVLSGEFLSVTINAAGHLGDGNAGPGLVFDPSGAGRFAGRPDHVSPATAFEGFGLKIDDAATVWGAANSSVPGLGGIVSTSLVDTSGVGSLSAVWTGTVAGLFTLRHEYGFDRAGSTLTVRTTITALRDLDDVRFARALDPDADADLPGGTHATANRRGDDATARPVDDLVSALAQRSGHGIDLFHVGGGNDHSTGIGADFAGPLDPDFYLGRNVDRNNPLLGDVSFGDHAIGLAYELGNLDGGESVGVEYAYRAWFQAPAVGGDGGTGGDAGGGTVPLPSTLALLGAALLVPLARRGR